MLFLRDSGRWKFYASMDMCFYDNHGGRGK